MSKIVLFEIYNIIFDYIYNPFTIVMLGMLKQKIKIKIKINFVHGQIRPRPRTVS
jgi:1-aminocyclopropane-1-carboxylate deaminase/D-cysteine desulfhydrase-like pyridoxal-dependent ACC family enzyme